MKKIFLIFTLIIIIPINLTEAEKVNQNSSDGTPTLSSVGTLVTIVSTMVAISTGLYGYITNRKNQTLKRQEIIFPLIEEFEKKKGIFYAKELIDNVPIRIDPSEKEFIDNPFKLTDSKGVKVYHTSDLSKLTESILDEDVLLIKFIMDSLLNFFGKLGYLIDNKLITKNDISYFLYYIEEAKDNKDVRLFATDFGYELFAVLLYKIGMITKSEKDQDFIALVDKHYNRSR